MLRLQHPIYTAIHVILAYLPVISRRENSQKNR